MVKPHPLDLRLKIIAEYKNKQGTMLQLAYKYNVSRSFVQKMIKQERETGNVVPIGNGNHYSKLTRHTQILEQIIQENPDSSLRSLCQILYSKTKLKVSTSTMHRFIRTMKSS